MKLFFALALFSSIPATAVLAADSSRPTSISSPASHRVVLELTRGEPQTWNAVLNNIENVRKSLGETSTHVKLVAHGKGLDFLKATQTMHQERMQKLAQAGVIFASSENAMKRQNVSKAQLLPLASTGDSDVAEIVRKQEDRWSYNRSGN
jgi:intracellular sulfur oxidation DsrE/DsrF family protein